MGEYDNKPLRVVHFMRHPREGAYSIERLYHDLRGVFSEDIIVETWTCGFESKGVINRLKDAWHARKNQGDVNHVTGDAHYLTYFLKKSKTVLTIHDLVSIKNSRGIRRLLFWLLWYWIPVQKSKTIIAISEQTRLDLVAMLRCNPEKIKVIHNPVSPEFSAHLKEFDTLCPRVLQIGTKPNKNIHRVAEALSGINCVMAIVGSLSDDDRRVLSRFQIRYDHFVGLSRNDLINQYYKSDIIMFASTYEGFGLPIIEGQSVGRAVVTSNVSSMPEVAGKGACLVDPYDNLSIRAAVIRLIEDFDYRSYVIENGYNNISRFSLEEIASKYEQAYFNTVSNI